MNKPHKHAEVIKAWADGMEIEYNYGDGWHPAPALNPAWYLTTEYRVKQKPRLSYQAQVMLDNLLAWQAARFTICKESVDSQNAVYKAREVLENYIMSLEAKA